MAVISWDQISRAPVITKAISRIKTPQQRFQQFFGVQLGGPNLDQPGGHYFGWDIFDKTRTLATGRAPGTGPATITPQVVGSVQARIARMHEKIPMLEERIFRTRRVGGGWGTAEIDRRGASYIALQQGFLGQRFKNMREFIVSRALRGGFDLLLQGDNWIPVDVGNGTFTVDFKIPAGNKNQLNMLGAGSIIGTTWLNPAAPIHENLLGINSASEQLHGRPIRHIWVNSVTWGYVLKNTGVINLGGTANTPFETYRPSGFSNEEGIPDTGFEGRLRGIPWITWHIYDAGCDVNGTFTKYIPDNIAIILPDPSPDWVSGAEGSEVVAENVQDPGVERFGFWAWTERQTQPASFELIAVDNFIMAIYVPNCCIYATVIF